MRFVTPEGLRRHPKRRRPASAGCRQEGCAAARSPTPKLARSRRYLAFFELERLAEPAPNLTGIPTQVSTPRARPTFVESLFDQPATEVLLRTQLIVRSTKQTKVTRRFISTLRPGLLVVDLQERARSTTTAIFSDERTAQPIARDDLSPRRVRHTLAMRRIAPHNNARLARVAKRGGRRNRVAPAHRIGCTFARRSKPATAVPQARHASPHALSATMRNAPPSQARPPMRRTIS
jgi:hypothetical protein